MRGLSRREFFGGAAGIAAVAVLPPGSSRAPLRTRPAAAAARTAATTPIVGATVNPSAYGVSDYLQAANIFNGFTGTTLATTFEKVYMSHGAFPQSPPSKITSLASAGCAFVISIEPSRTLTTDEQTLVTRFCHRMTAAGLTYRIVLYSEANDKAFKTQQDWQTYWSFYAPAVKAAGVTCGFNPGCGFQAIGRAEQYFPTNPTPDELWMDYYATAFRGGSRLDTLIGIAKSAGVQAGLAEWGWSAGDTTFGPMTIPWWNDYCSYLTQLASNGDVPLGAMYFGAKANGRTSDIVKSANDPRIPQILAVSQAIQNG